MKYMNISKKSIALIVSLFALLIVSMSVANTYNAMVTGGNAVDNSWAKVETQEQRRYDLIDAMVQSVKGSQFQEQEVFSSIAQGRNAYKSASTTDEKVEAASSIATNIALLPRLQEAYPELKSNDQVTALMNELKSTENNILSARDSYNDTATNYNNYLTRFPKNVYANLFDFDKRSLFEASEESRKAPDFNFNDIRR